MEDISRELEREIARSKPKPFSQNRKTKLLILDDFGKMKSGDYYKTIVRFLSVISVISLAAAIVLYFLYTDLLENNNLNKAKYDTVQKKVLELTAQKEVLMAKIVIAGKEIDFTQKNLVADKKEIPPPLESINEEKIINPVKNEEEIIPPPFESSNEEIIDPLKNGKVKIKSDLLQKDIKPETAQEIVPAQQPISLPQEPKPLDPVEPAKIINKTVTIENFTVKKARSNKDLLVRFDIRKLPGISGDASGRIFTLLQPDNSSEDKWLVVPDTPLKNGIPTEYDNGQYFSITHYKPVKFKIKNLANPNYFKKAAIFIFNEQEDLIFNKLIKITDVQ